MLPSWEPTIGDAITEVIEIWQIAKKTSYVKKPISYALYHCWKKFNYLESSRDIEVEEN